MTRRLARTTARGPGKGTCFPFPVPVPVPGKGKQALLSSR